MAVQTIKDTALMCWVACDGVVVDSAPGRVLLAPWGQVESSAGDFLIDHEAAALMVEAFNAHGVDLPIDYEHQTLGGQYAAPDGKAPAAGWIRGLDVVAGEGIYGRVEWNDRGRRLVLDREYRFLSPVLMVREGDRRAIEVHSVALTNKPAIARTRPIVNKAGESGLAAENQMLRASLRAAYFQNAKGAFFGPSLANTDRGTRTIAASSSRSATYTPSPEEQREQIVATAARDYHHESAHQVVLCSQRAWVDQALRDANMPTLTATEARDLGLSEEPQVSSRKPAFARSVNAARAAVETLPLAERRPAIIRKASDEFRADETARRVCSCRAWCNNALREAGMEPMTETELRTHSIRVDD